MDQTASSTFVAVGLGGASAADGVARAGARLLKLNVGGRRHYTTLETLTRGGGPSFFTAMFSGKFGLVYDEQGFIFIDRDGYLFRHVLNFLRSGSLHVGHRLELQEQLLEEALFYGLQPMVDCLRHSIEQLRAEEESKEEVLFSAMKRLLLSRSPDSLKDGLLEDDREDAEFLPVAAAAPAARPPAAAVAAPAARPAAAPAAVAVAPARDNDNRNHRQAGVLPALVDVGDDDAAEAAERAAVEARRAADMARWEAYDFGVDDVVDF